MMSSRKERKSHQEPEETCYMAEERHNTACREGKGFAPNEGLAWPGDNGRVLLAAYSKTGAVQRIGWGGMDLNVRASQSVPNGSHRQPGLRPLSLVQGTIKMSKTWPHLQKLQLKNMARELKATWKATLLNSKNG